ncbi:MAG: ATP-dependent sacrificial sulfur transferase LarE [Fibromonadales bacterium]|nr:ATP-dependent sacrificial sulfur transferase LarE [Fibromonadales bacterium]
MTLESFFKENPLVALGFSGGVDSSYLLYAGLRYGAKIKAYFVKTEFQPEFELKDALKLAKQIGADITVIEKNILSNEKVSSNPDNRCYFCKKEIFETICAKAQSDGIKLVIDGTNASDCANERPGIKALQELSVRSPLRECGIAKSEVRRLSQEAGLFTWNKNAYACLATRILNNRPITKELLRKTEKVEDALIAAGFTNFRARVLDEKTMRLEFYE